MSWSIGFDSRWHRDIGYGVPAYCDHPGCNAEIDRGLSHVCGGEAYGGEHGCGLYFCGKHLAFYEVMSMAHPQLCERCGSQQDAFTPKPDHPDWIKHKLHDESWAEWREQNKGAVKEMVGA